MFGEERPDNGAQYTLLIHQALTILVFHHKFDRLLLSFKY